MKKQIMKLAGASILAFCLSFLTFMSLTVAVQDVHEKENVTAIQTEQSYEDHATLASVHH